MKSAAEHRVTGGESEQAAIVDFLSDPTTFNAGGSEVLRIDTHAARIFAAGELAMKIKRAVRYPYLDFTTLEARRQALSRELEINRTNAPEIYLDLTSISRLPDGTLELGSGNGDGVIVEWALRMRRFEQSALLSQIAPRGLSTDLLKRIADEVIRSHRSAPVHRIDDASARVAAVAEEIREALRATWADDASRLHDGLMTELSRSSPIIERRAATGFVRRCHGDLHLGNIVMWHDRPTLFDALEFDEGLAIIDTLYDLAFLMMDLDIRATSAASNVVLNRYLWRSNAPLDLEGLAALPVFLALRAGIRSMTSLQRAADQAGEAAHVSLRQAERYLEQALAYVSPSRPALVAVGGLSGTGKSTLAAGLAPLLGPSPGAIHLRSDLERKAYFGVDELERLPPSAYGSEQSRCVYDALIAKASLVLGARHAVVADAVFADADERSAVEKAAQRAGVPFLGLWLSASHDTMVERVRSRINDASDATADVVDVQVQRGVGQHDWVVIDAGGSSGETLARAITALRSRISDALFPERNRRMPI